MMGSARQVNVLGDPGTIMTHGPPYLGNPVSTLAAIPGAGSHYHFIRPDDKIGLRLLLVKRPL